MWWAIFRCVKIILISSAVSLCISFGLGVNVSAWSADVVPEFISSDLKVYNSYPCYGLNSIIAVSGEGSTNACIMGIVTQIAAFYPAEGGVGHAIKFPYDSTFYRLDICNNDLKCAYSDSTDTIISSSGMYSNVSKHLKRTIYQGVIHYVPDDNYELATSLDLFGRSLPIQTVALSDNGVWAMIEIRDYGFVRVNVQTKQNLRFVAPGINYGYGSDPGVEMAISNDGKSASMMGSRMSVALVKIDTICGDVMNVYSTANYRGATTACLYIPTSPSSYINNFVYAMRPKFSANSETFSFDIFSSSTTGKHITLFSNEAPQSSLRYLAMGDSFSSGEGETDDSYYLGGAQNACHISSRSYPFLLAAKWSVLPENSSNVACSGATMNTARTKASGSYYSQLATVEATLPNVVTIGIGGNDAGLMGKLKDCLNIDTCKWAETAKDRKSTALEIKELYPKLKEFYLEIKTRALGPVLVVGYPQIITPGAVCLSAEGLLLNQTERTFMNESIRYLNQVAQAAATDAGIDYVDTENSLLNGNLCTAISATYMNGIRFGDDFPNIPSIPIIKFIGTETFHPKPAGQVKIVETIVQKYINPSNIRSIMTVQAGSTVPEPSEYWSSQANQKVQRAVSFLNKIEVGIEDVLNIKFPSLTFKAGAEVVLELHSDVKTLATVKAADDGSLNVSVSTLDFDEGYHSLHAIGMSAADTVVDYYDFLSVEVDKNSSNSVPVVVSSVIQNGAAGIVASLKNQLSALSKSGNSTNTSPVSIAGIMLNQEIVADTQSTPNGGDVKNGNAKRGTVYEKISYQTIENRQLKRYFRIIIAVVVIVLLIVSVLLYKFHRKIVSRNNDR